MQLIYEKSRPGRRAITFDALDVPEASLPEELKRGESAELPEVSELDVVRHYTNLSRRNFGIDSHFYPLGSCTMKYNPKMAETVANLPGYANMHPHLGSCDVYKDSVQGVLEILHKTESMLAEIAGMREASLQPIAGAHGELTGTLLIAAYHRQRGNTHKDTIIVPDSAHGTNPASAVIAGFKIVEVPSGPNGTVPYEEIEKVMGDHIAGFMTTCPNTHGLFEPDVKRIADLLHASDALLYYDGANLNAILGVARPGDLGFDVMHYNLHKTFATPHGMGGPGSGPVGVSERLMPYLPGPRVIQEEDGSYGYMTPEHSIGRIATYCGNFMMAVRAFAYMRHLGAEGLKEVSEIAVLNANYVLARLKDTYTPAFGNRCLHECIFTATPEAKRGIRALDIGKALLDYGIHAPTVYFPLTVKESIMIEPTETESKETLDEFVDAMLEIHAKIDSDPDALHAAPTTLPVKRLDEVGAARNLNCACLPPGQPETAAV